MSSEHRLFSEDPSQRKLSLPWGRTVEMCWRNLKNRRGRFLLVFLSIAVVVAFFVSTLSYHRLLEELRGRDDVHTRAVLERGGVLSHNPEADRKHRDQMVWLLVLSGMLCFVGVMNTMYMSVTERYREIGTLKCLGALDSFVVRLFLLESVFIGAVGSALGALGGFLLTLFQIGVTLEFGLIGVGHVMRTLAQTAPPAFAGGTALTVLAAIYPTIAAARMKPVDAMRVEV